MLHYKRGLPTSQNLVVGSAFFQNNLPNLLNLGWLVFMKHLTTYMRPKQRWPGRVYTNVDMRTLKDCLSHKLCLQAQLHNSPVTVSGGSGVLRQEWGASAVLVSMRRLATGHAPSLKLLCCNTGLAGWYVSGSEAQFRVECSTRTEACHQKQKLWVPGPRCGLPACLDWLHLSVASPTGATKNTTGEFSTAGAEHRAQLRKKKK